jgi:hypothetical protein
MNYFIEAVVAIFSISLRNIESMYKTRLVWPWSNHAPVDFVVYSYNFAIESLPPLVRMSNLYLGRDFVHSLYPLSTLMFEMRLLVVTSCVTVM